MNYQGMKTLDFIAHLESAYEAKYTPVMRDHIIAEVKSHQDILLTVANEVMKKKLYGKPLPLLENINDTIGDIRVQQQEERREQASRYRKTEQPILTGITPAIMYAMAWEVVNGNFKMYLAMMADAAEKGMAINSEQFFRKFVQPEFKKKTGMDYPTEEWFISGNGPKNNWLNIRRNATLPREKTEYDQGMKISDGLHLPPAVENHAGQNKYQDESDSHPIY
jgi:hypothetical protein